MTEDRSELMGNFDPMRLTREDLVDFAPYTASTLMLRDFDRICRLDTNENPFGASPRARAALAEMRHWNRYASQDELLPEIASYVGVDPAHVVASNGADEMIDLVQRMFLAPGDAVVDCPPAFEMYAHFGRLNGARVLEVPHREDFSLDVDGIEAVVAREHPKIIFLANPNNPDGGSATPEQIERLLALPLLVVLDEAYAEFSGESYAGRVPTQPNLVVIRTFSKWAGLAGLRIGYCVAPAAIAELIMRTKSPYNVNAAAIVAGRASLEDKEYLMANVRRIIAERERLSAGLAHTGLLQPLPSRANFLLCRVLGCDAHRIRDALAARGILIRAFASPRLRDFVRISVGTPEQDDMLLKALEQIV